MTFTAVVTAHESIEGLRRITGNLIYQTRPPDEILVYVSDIPTGILREYEEDFAGHHVFVSPQPNMEDWGHDKRSKGIEDATCEWLGFFNHDDSYVNEYVEKMLGASDGVDAVFCDWSAIPNCEFRRDSSTSGNYIVRTSVAQDIGYPWRDYSADGHFIEVIANRFPFRKVPELLYFHNDFHAEA